MTHSFVHGRFADPAPDVISELTLQIQAIDFVMQWRRCGMTADFLAEFLAYGYKHREAARNVVSTVANELIENAVKFSADKSRPVWTIVRNLGSALQLEAVNLATEAQVASFQETLAMLNQGDPHNLFVAQVERSQSETLKSSGIGLIVLCRDYGASLSVQAVPEEETLYRVTVRVTLRQEEIERR
jgi:hypothetical protein